ncbi:MAG: DUF444 family protein [Planctomycetota bacterium]|jgi:uncharacterized sporulation protein YeaH/YhbH (DUF444 family)
MSLRVEQDLNRFRQIVRGRIRKNLRKYMSEGELIGRVGKELVSIPIPQIDIPSFRYGENESGVGQGEGDEGTPVDGEGDGAQAGDSPGEHLLEVDISLSELADILGEELELPAIEPKGTGDVQDDRQRYNTVRRTGPDSLLHFKRTYRQALKRQLMSGTYDPKRPIIIPVREDRVYRAGDPAPTPNANAVIFYLMDVSGSMGDEQKDVVRTEAFWIDTWIRRHYPHVDTRYVVHDAAAREVDQETFFHLKESGGTKISSAYELLDRLITEEYDPMMWNIYPFHFSDGDNWGSGDTEKCLTLLRERLIPVSNQFAYGQVESPYGSGQFLKDLNEYLADEEKLVTSNITSKDKILDSIKDFLGAGN